MKTIIMVLSVSLSLWMFGCTPQDDEVKKTYDISNLEIVPHPDTLFMSVNDVKVISLRGTSLTVSSRTLSNTGLMTDISYTVRSVDTTTVPIPASDGVWVSSNTGVATVSQGLVVARNPGFVTISATVGKVQSNGLLVNVKAVNTAPGLLLNPPQYSLIFQDSIAVAGNVQVPATLSIVEPSSGHNTANVQFDASGNFSEHISGLVKGFRTITATAHNINDPSLTTTRFKYVYYYTYLSPEADSIVGNWLGTTLGQNFNFAISKNTILPRYDINGHIDIQFDGLGVVRDISLTGIVNKDGTMDVQLSGNYEGFSIIGTLNGYFKTVGTGEGSYGASANKPGWPSLSGTADWTAVKIP